MDLGCIDMGCIEKQSREISPEKESSTGSGSSDSFMATSKIGKNKAMKESGQSNWNAFSKCTSQIRKPPHRKTSPLNWFPRKKVDSYLKRKIKLLQEVDGMNSTLDETLGDANLHYSRVLKEKIAVKEAATKAMDARKSAMVEASWCRILKAASIDCKDAEAQLVEAEKVAAEAFEAATASGVTMYDIPDCSQKSCKIESLTAKGGSATHAVSASFETAFEVDKQVAYAVKIAFTKLANCSSIKKNEFRELVRKICQNPDSDENSEEFSGISSECDSDTGSELEVESSGVRQRKYKREHVSEKLNMANLVELMLERLKGLQEDELASLATIVATCGLNSALAKAESAKKHDSGSTTTNQLCVPAPRRISISGAGSFRNFGMDGQKKMMDETQLPSLDKFLVKKLTRLEREVLEAKNARNHEAKEADKQQIAEGKKISEELVNGEQINNSVPELGDVLVKHFPKVANEIQEARKNQICSATHDKKLDRVQNKGGNCINQDLAELPSLDKFLVKHMSRLEKEVQEAKNRRNFEEFDEGCKVNENRKATPFPPNASQEEISSFSDQDPSLGKENINLNMNVDCDLDLNKGETSLMKSEELSSDAANGTSKDSEELSCDVANGTSKDAGKCPNNERMQSSLINHCNIENQHMRAGGNDTAGLESLDKILVKHVSKLEREKMEFQAKEGAFFMHARRETKKELEMGCGGEGLDQVLVKHKSRLEREKMSAAASAAAAAPSENPVMYSVARREARQKELQEAWGGLSLGNSMRPHLSRLQRDKAAWLKAEEEERKKATQM